MNKTFEVGIIGGGGIAHAACHTYRELVTLEIVAVADGQPLGTIH